MGLSQYDGLFTKNHSILLVELQEKTTYYFEVNSYDYSGNLARENNSGFYYQFTTEKQPDEGNGGDGNGGGIPSGDGKTNKLPHAHANGPYYGLVNHTMVFDASNSNDTDGYLVNYTWNFGDGTILSTTQLYLNHGFKNVGNFTVRLTVRDNDNGTNTTSTYALISTNDTDGDGWSNDAERKYGTDPMNASDYPADFDGDGLPDSVDADDDNDGLTDETEIRLGLNSFNNADVFHLINGYGLFFLLDTNGDSIYDRYYNQTTGLITVLKDLGNGTYLIDVNGDVQYDYKFVSSELSIFPYAASTNQQPLNNLILVMLIVGCIVVIFILLIIVYGLRYQRSKKYKGGDNFEKK